MVDLAELKTAEKKLDQQLRKIRKLTGSDSERDRDAARKRRLRAAGREVVIPPCADPERRARLEANDEEWLAYYCGDLFWYDFTGQQRAMIEAIRHAIRYGGDQSLAASRGEGKTKLFERMLLKHSLSGEVTFAVLFAATGSAAQDSLQSIRDTIETNEKLYDDYPEVCVPVRALENTPNRAHYQTVSGKRIDNGVDFSQVPSRFSWCGHEIVFPRVPGSPSNGAIIATRGLDAAVRGLNKNSRRVQVAGIDDPDTEETVRSEDQAHKLEERIDRAIAGLGGQQRSVARVMLSTIQRRECVSAWYTDPSKKPSWKGKRFRFLLKKPDREDLWDEYVQLRQLNHQTTDEEGNFTDPNARGAHNFYLENREAMDAGAEVANPHRFDAQELPDGSQLEVSALQRYYNEVARIGPEAVASEYDNDPPEETGPIESGITAHRIQRQVNGYPRRVVPPGCTVVTQGIDVRKIALHYVVRAWRPGATGFTIHYDVQEVRGTIRGSDEGVEHAIIRALEERKSDLESNPYTTEDGEIVPVVSTLVDAGWKTPAIYHFCKLAGKGWWPAMGFGKSNGCVKAAFNMPSKDSATRRSGQDWFLTYQREPKVWLVACNADGWKSWEHARWLTDPSQPGSMTLWGKTSGGKRLSDDEQKHFAYSKHLTAEVEVEEVVKGILQRSWKSKSDNNHYLDASYLCDVAANMAGIRLLGGTGRTAVKADSRPSLADLAKGRT